VEVEITDWLNQQIETSRTPAAGVATKGAS